MKLLINASNNLTGGSLQIAISFISECRKISEYDYVVVLGDNIAEQINEDEYPSYFKFYRIKSNPFFTLKKKLNRIERSEHPDRVFTIFGPSFWRPKAKHIMGLARLELFIGIINSSFFKSFSLFDKFIWYGKKIIHSYFINKDVDVIISETEMASNLFKVTCNKVKSFYVVSNNCSSYFRSYTSHYINKRYSYDFKLLTLSNYRKNKNFECIPYVIRELHLLGIFDVKFIITIDNAIYKRLFSGYEKDVINVGPQRACDCPQLYDQCDAMFLPTFLECFSASYPEAMIMRKPILTSDLEFAHNICGKAALYFNPNDYRDIAQKIYLLKTSTTIYNDLVKQGEIKLKDFPTPEDKTKQYLNIIFNK